VPKNCHQKFKKKRKKFIKNKIINYYKINIFTYYKNYFNGKFSAVKIQNEKENNNLY
jgi:hypothetical protein